MIEVQGRQYAIALLDTNILSEMLKDMDRFGTRVLERIDHRRSFVGITTYSVQELRRRKDLFDSLVEVMSWLPTVLLKSGGVLLDDEVRCYATHESMDPILLSPLGIQGADGMSQAEAIRTLLEYRRVVTGEKELESGLDSLWQLYTTRSKEWMTAGLAPNARTLRAYATAVCAGQIGARHGSWVAELGKPLDLERFPSVKSGAYSAFIRFASDKRKPRRSDVLDLAMASAFPYVDSVGIEAHQAEVLRKIARVDPFLDHLDIFTLRELDRLG